MLARWYKTGNCAVEAVDLGRREERTRRSNEGDKRGSSSLPPSFSLTLFLFLSLSASRALPFESPRHKRISTRQRSYSPLNRASSRRAFVAPPSFILVSSLRAERSGDEKSFILADGGPSQSHRRRGGAQFFLLYLSFLPFLPLPLFVDNTIALTTLSFVLALGALFPLPFSPFSIVSHFEYFPSSALPLLLFISFFLRNFLLSRSFYAPFSILFLFFSAYLVCPSPSSLSVFLAQNTGAHFFLLPTLIHVDISARRTNRPTDE